MVEVMNGKVKVQGGVVGEIGKPQKLEDLEVVVNVNMVDIDLVYLDVPLVGVEFVGEGKEKLDSLGGNV